MRILITGHLGYIGPVMIRLLKEHGHTVTGLDIGYFRECTVARQTFTPPDFEIVKDIRDVTKLDFEGQEAVIHLAALSNDPLGALDPELTFNINLKASTRAAMFARQAGVRRFVFSSSCSIYGAAGDFSIALDERAPFKPVSAYAVSKVETEKSLRALADENFSPVYLRNATAYGVSARTRLDLVLNNLMAYAHTSGEIRVLSDGTPWRPMVHIEDIAGAALAAVTASRASIHNEAFNIGRNDANYQVRDIAEIVAKIVPQAKLVITGQTGGDARSYRVDFSKALVKLPGFTPRWTLEAGALQLDQWIRGGGLANEPFDGRRFIRLKQLRYLMETGAVDMQLHPRLPL